MDYNMSKTTLNDIVITFDEKLNTENRLRHILRAIENSCIGYNEIIIIGDKPDWLQGVIHIGFNGEESKDQVLKNKYRKLKSVCLNKSITEGFYWIDADDAIIKFDATRATRIALKEESVLSYKPKGTEIISLQHTKDLMNRRGFTHKGIYFNKFPMSFTKEKLRNTFDDIDFETKYGYCIKTLYANFNRLNPTEKEIEILNLTDFINPSTYEKI